MFEYPDNSIPTTPSNFLALPPSRSDIETSGIVILPVPYDSTTSFRVGSREGPRAISEASAALEDYDLEMDLDVAGLGIYTAPVLEPHLGSPELNVERVSQAVSCFLAPNKLVGVIGGEHSITAGSVLAHKEVYPDLSVLYLDAHCDLRDDIWELGGGMLPEVVGYMMYVPWSSLVLGVCAKKNGITYGWQAVTMDITR